MTTYKQHSFINRSAIVLLAVLVGLTLALTPYTQSYPTSCLKYGDLK
ncbi:MAG: hypothetical protein HQL61_02025 [Magnetococcales bacterium]|nr:hypothetical protein [Nitrospirota bacterium]